MTTLASTISDRFALEQWAQRGIVKGFAANETLQLRAVAAGEDRDALDAVAKAALDAARSSEAAAIGTALHSITERLDAGEYVEVPASFKPDVDAYQASLRAARLQVVPGAIERFVVVPELGAAGTPDRLYETTDEVGLPMIGDLKTGANAIKFGLVEIAAQLAIYSRATHWWDGECHHPMPVVDQAVGIVAHMPAGRGTCDIYSVDLDRGWEIALLCLKARELRRSKGLASLRGQRAPTDPDASLKDRVKEVVEALEGALLPIPWPIGVVPPKRQQGAYSEFEVELIERWCDATAAKTTKPPF